MPFVEGVAMGSNGAEHGVLGAAESIQILRRIFERSIVKVESQDSPELLARQKSCQDLYQASINNDCLLVSS
jgi:hypothetical protein